MKGRRHYRRPSSGTAPTDPFVAIPAIAEGVQARKDSLGLLQIRAERPPKGPLARLAARLGLRRSVRVNLDEYGTLFWEGIDGSRSLAEIARIVCEQTKQDAAECNKAILLFTRLLMLRGLIYLAIPHGEPANRQDPLT